MASESAPRLYQGERQFENFCRMSDFYSTVEVAASAAPFLFPDGPAFELPATYRFDGDEKSTERLIEETDTSAILVIQDGRIRHESYYLTGGESVRWTSWSVAKSYISALVGIAIAEGHIKSIDDPISSYAPHLNGSAYENVRIRHVLQMSSGARWSEDYSNPKSDVNRLGTVMRGETSLDDFVAAIEPEREPGTYCQYNSADTQALGMLLRGATGMSITDYMRTRLTDPLGHEHSGYWLVDKDGVELVLGGLNLTARDFARIGELYRNQGNWQGQQIVPASWVKASTHSSEPHLQAHSVMVGGHPFAFGYGYQWWLPVGDRGAYSAIGVYNQFVFVDPKSRSVIVKLSANPRYGLSEEESDNREEETVAMLEAFVEHLEA